MLVRFIKNYSSNTERRMSYELVSDEIRECLTNYVYIDNYLEDCYELKLLGFVPVRKLEPADGTDEPAINLFVQLSNL